MPTQAIITPIQAFIIAVSTDAWYDEVITKAERCRNHSGTEALTKFQQLAAENNPLGEFGLGLCYQYHIGITADQDKATTYFKTAANADCSIAQHHLGTFEPMDVSMPWWTKSASNFYPPTQYELGLQCLHGGILAGCFPRPRKALEFFLSATEAGYLPAQQQLALMHIDKELCKIDDIMAFTASALFYDLVQRGNREAIFGLARCHQIPGSKVNNDKLAAFWIDQRKDFPSKQFSELEYTSDYQLLRNAYIGQSSALFLIGKTCQHNPSLKQELIRDLTALPEDTAPAFQSTAKLGLELLRISDALPAKPEAKHRTPILTQLATALSECLSSLPADLQAKQTILRTITEHLVEQELLIYQQRYPYRFLKPQLQPYLLETLRPGKRFFSALPPDCQGYLQLAQLAMLPTIRQQDLLLILGKPPKTMAIARFLITLVKNHVRHTQKIATINQTMNTVLRTILSETYVERTYAVPTGFETCLNMLQDLFIRLCASFSKSRDTSPITPQPLFNIIQAFIDTEVLMLFEEQQMYQHLYLVNVLNCEDSSELQTLDPEAFAKLVQAQLLKLDLAVNKAPAKFKPS